MIGHKTYYKTNDVREFVNKHCDHWTIEAFEK